MKILLVEDDAEVSAYVARGLIEAGHGVDVVAYGQEALAQAKDGDYAVWVVDRMLPGLDGLSLIKALRAIGNDTPALILSALGDVDHRVEGLKAGSDDYLTKPFAFSELLARIEGLARRARPDSGAVALAVGSLTLDLLSRRVVRDGEDIELLPREFALLEYLMRHTNQVVTRTMLLEHVWSLNFDPKTNIVDVHISRLRQKLDQAGEKPPLIETVRGAGYIIRE